MKQLVVAGFLLVACPAQGPEAFWIEWAPGASVVVVGVLWPCGSDDARAELGAVAAALAEVRLDRARAVAPDVVASVHVDAEVTCIVGTLPAAAAAQAQPFAAALLDDRRPFADDAIALAVARAALRCDDQRFVVPGGVLVAHARAALGVHRGPSYGDPVAMSRLAPADVRALLARPVGAQAAAAGELSHDLVEGLRALPLVAVARAPRTLPEPAPADGTLHQEEHARVDQPFVMAAFRAPDAAELPAFAVAVEAARARAARRWQLRGSEIRARTPFVAFSWLEGDGIVCFFRRGENPRVLLPGEVAADAAAELAATRAEVEALLQDLRQNPTSEVELSQARTVLLAELGLAGPGLAGADGPVLAGRLRAAMLARWRGIDPQAVRAVPVDAVRRALATALAGPGYWHALMPAPRKDRGWRRR